MILPTHYHHCNNEVTSFNKYNFIVLKEKHVGVGKVAKINRSNVLVFVVRITQNDIIDLLGVLRHVNQ